MNGIIVQSGVYFQLGCSHRLREAHKKLIEVILSLTHRACCLECYYGMRGGILLGECNILPSWPPLQCQAIPTITLKGTSLYTLALRRSSELNVGCCCKAHFLSFGPYIKCWSVEQKGNNWKNSKNSRIQELKETKSFDILKSMWPNIVLNSMNFSQFERNYSKLK